MKTTTLLERNPLPEMAPEDLINQNVLDYADRTLGYRHPHKQRLACKGRLAQALKVAGIQPFTNESVAAYKEKMLGQKTWLYSFLNNNNSDAFQVIGALGLLCSVATFVFSGSTSYGYYVGGGSFWFSWHHAFWTLVSGALVAIFGTIGFFGHLLKTQPYEYQVSWEIKPLANYDQPVPEFALATSMELHQRVPEVKFSIDQFVVTKARKITQDPFLIAELGEEKYYIEVWDEPGYKQERKA